MDWRSKLRYWFDNMTSRGTGAMIAMLFMATMVLVAVVSAAVILSGSDPMARGFTGVAWASLLRTLDPGTMGDDQGPVFFLLAMLTVTIGGLFVVGTLIGIITTGIESRLEAMRKGRSFVAEEGHTVILGWSSQVFTVVSQLIEATPPGKRGCIAILADMDKVLMDDEIRARVTGANRVRVVCRTGYPMDPADLEIVNHAGARSIIVLPPDTESPDSSVIKTILALLNNPSRKSRPYHIVSILRSPENMEVAGMVGGDEAQLILAGDIIARITAQTCRQPGLSAVYSELLSFHGNEIYFGNQRLLSNETFSRALHAFEDSCLIGIRRPDGSILLNPPPGTVVGEDDGVVAISGDEESVSISGLPLASVDEAAVSTLAEVPGSPERILVLGWNRRVPRVIQELDAYAAPGSRVVLGTDQEAEIGNGYANITVDVRHGNPADRSFLDSLDLGAYDHVVVQSNSDSLPPQQADALTLVTLLHLRHIRVSLGLRFTIVTEMLDERNRRLAEVSNMDDFIVSDKIVSLLLTQIAMNREIMTVFEELFDPRGSEIYLKPAGLYVTPGIRTNFHTVALAASRRGETAIGVSTSDGVTLNPRKSAMMTLTGSDRVIVLAAG